MRKLCLISLGCDKNLVDSEIFLGYLTTNGYTYTDDETEADTIIINSCCFILDAKQESIDTILRVAEYKHGGVLKELIVMGCLAERYREEIIKEIPEVDRIITVEEFDKFIKDNAPVDRLLSGTGYTAYLKIADGCNKRCTYCIIPKLRGKYRSYPMEELLRQAEYLADNGVRELIIVAQETTVYGSDLYGKKMLPELLRSLCKIKGLRWIRLLYAYPEEIDDELIRVMAEEEKICHYIDMPIQHSCDRILKVMGRRTSQKDIEDKVNRLRSAIPDIVIRTTLISGFPGETEDEHRRLLDFVNKMRFEHLGVFAYSQEEDTPAAEFPDQIDEDIKEARRNEIMELQQKISEDHLSEMTDRQLDVMIEGRLPDEKVLVGRTYMDAPEVDGYIFIDEKKKHDSGAFIRVRVTGSSEYDLIGEEI